MGCVAGAAGGLITGLLHTKLRIDPLLASILTMIGLYSINLRIMRGPLVALLGEQTVFTPLKDRGMLFSWVTVTVLAAVVFVIKLVIDWFLSTNFGLAVQATGDNPGMAASMGVNTDLTKIVTLMMANGLVGLSGALYAQFQGSADSQMGIGLILVGLASVIVGNALLGTRFMFLASLGVIVGSVLYRLVIYAAVSWRVLEAGDMKLVSAVLVVVALVLSGSRSVRGLGSKLTPWKSRAGAR
jgi:putative ABC transport system permease protein